MFYFLKTQSMMTLGSAMATMETMALVMGDLEGMIIMTPMIHLAMVDITVIMVVITTVITTMAGVENTGQSTKVTLDRM